MTAFLDTNVLIYLANPKESHHSWSFAQLQSYKTQGPVIISDIVYCEFSAGMKNKSDVDAVISQFALERIRASDNALFRAGVAYKSYKNNKNGEKKLNVLPDFLIGAIAVDQKAPLITADPTDFKRYFDDIQLVCP